jgi:2,4-dienoyl-CoA reductase-like NADH-dependent reductase (Old Yellow Enzyme family)
MTERQSHDVVARFAEAGRAVVRAGSTGVQVHAAHGYLLSQFSQRPTARWAGGTPKRCGGCRRAAVADRRAVAPR